MGRIDEALRRAAEEQARLSELAAVPAGSGEGPGPDEGVYPVEHLPGLQMPSPPPVPSAVDDMSSAPESSAPVRLIDSLDTRLRGRLVPDATMAPGSREQYRRLAAALYHSQAASGLKVVMIASAVAAEGKTLTAANLALTLSESYHRTVFLVDADLRRPSIHTVFNVEPIPGLSEGLVAPEHYKLQVHQVSEHLTVLPAGRPSTDPMAALISSRMRRLIDEARETFDWVILDTPPVGLMTDANLLAAMTDGTVLVVKANVTSYQSVQRAIDAIGKDRILGAVLNRATISAAEGSKYYDYYYNRTAPSPD